MERKVEVLGFTENKQILCADTNEKKNVEKKPQDKQLFYQTRISKMLLSILYRKL